MSQETQAQRKERLRGEAERRTENIVASLKPLDQILAQALARDHRVNFDGMRKVGAFREPPPPQAFVKPMPSPPDPARASSIFTRLAEKLSPEGAPERYRREYQEWVAECANVTQLNARRQAEFYDEVRRYEQRKAEHEQRRVAADGRVDWLESGYRVGEPKAIAFYFGIVLDRSEYPSHFPRGGSVEFQPEDRTLVVKRPLPQPNILPSVIGVRYVASKDTFEDVEPSAKERAGRYTRIVCQIALRSLYEVFQADEMGLVQMAVFNGVVDAIDKATGHPAKRCVASVRASRQQFLALKLQAVDPAACFQGLGGVLSTPSDALKAVRPFAEFRS